jgi:chromosome segregation ATPase
MEELKRDVREVKTELDDELKRLNGLKDAVEANKDLIAKIHNETKQVTVVQRKEIDTMEECVKACQITIAQHDERLKAFENHAKRQNGLLEELAHGIGTVTKKVDAVSLEIANRFSAYERHAVSRDTERDTAVAKALAEANANVAKALAEANLNIVTAKEKADTDVDELRAEFIQEKLAFNWKIIAATSTIAFFLFIVILTVSLHIFGALPGLP